MERNAKVKKTEWSSGGDSSLQRKSLTPRCRVKATAVANKKKSISSARRSNCNKHLHKMSQISSKKIQTCPLNTVKIRCMRARPVLTNTWHNSMANQDSGFASVLEAVWSRQEAESRLAAAQTQPTDTGRFSRAADKQTCRHAYVSVSELCPQIQQQPPPPCRMLSDCVHAYQCHTQTNTGAAYRSCCVLGLSLCL